MHHKWLTLLMMAHLAGCGGRATSTVDGEENPAPPADSSTSDEAPTARPNQARTEGPNVSSEERPELSCRGWRNQPMFLANNAPEVRIDNVPTEPVAYTARGEILPSSTGSTSYSASLSAKSGHGLGVSFRHRSGPVAPPFTLYDLASLPADWTVHVSYSHCSVGGTDACQMLQMLSTDRKDRFEGWMALQRSPDGEHDLLFVCLSGASADPSDRPHRMEIFTVVELTEG